MRVAQYLLRGTGFNDFAMPHHDNAVCNFRDHAEVVGDEQHCRAVAALQFLHQMEDLRLSGHVQRSCGFVRNDQRRFQCQRHGNDHTLALPSRQLVRVAVYQAIGVGQVHIFQQFQHALPAFCRLEVGVDFQHLVNLPAHLHQGAQCGHGLLKHHGNAATAHGPHVVLAQVHKVAPLEHDFAACDPQVWFGQQAHDGFAHDGLA